MPDPPPSWDRILPKPLALQSNGPVDPFGGRPSSLLQPPRERDRFLSGRPNSCRVQGVASGEHASNAPEIETLSRKRTVSVMAGEGSSPSSSPNGTSPPKPAGWFCLCQPDPKIPRPRNGEPSRDSRESAGATLTTHSIHSFSTASPGRHSSAKPRLAESGHFKDHRRTMAAPPRRGQKRMESACRSMSKRSWPIKNIPLTSLLIRKKRLVINSNTLTTAINRRGTVGAAISHRPPEHSTLLQSDLPAFVPSVVGKR